MIFSQSKPMRLFLYSILIIPLTYRIVKADTLEISGSTANPAIVIPGGETYIKPDIFIDRKNGKMEITFDRNSISKSITQGILSDVNSILRVESYVMDSFYVKLKIMTIPFASASLSYDILKNNYIVEITYPSSAFLSDNLTLQHPAANVKKSTVFVTNLKIVSRVMFLLSFLFVVIGLIYFLFRGKNARGLLSLLRNHHIGRFGGVPSDNGNNKRNASNIDISSPPKTQNQDLSYDEIKILSKLNNKNIDFRV